MHILHIIQRYWPVRGGAELHFGEISERLAADGHQVTVATTDARDFELFWRPSARRLEDATDNHAGVHILRFPVRHLPLPSLAYPGMRRLLWILSHLRPVPVDVLSRLARWTPWVPGLWRWLRKTDQPFDLVAGMTITFEPLLEAGLRFARRRGIPFVVYPLTHLGAGPKPAQDALSRFYTMRHQVDLVRRSDAVVAQTPAERDFYVSRGVDAAKLHVVGPGFTPADVLGGNAKRFRARHGLRHPIVFMLTSMSYDKGVNLTIAAMERLWAQGCEAHLVLAGSVLESFAATFRRLPAETKERILLLGSVTDEEKRDLLAAGDVMAMPSRTDSFGIIYLEAWAYGTPVIGARTWGVMDVIDDRRDGLLVPFGDVSALSDALAYLLEHPGEARAMGEGGRTKALRDHTWDRKIPQIHNLYRELGQARN